MMAMVDMVLRMSPAPPAGNAEGAELSWRDWLGVCLRQRLAALEGNPARRF
jgi:hypothetical protein